MKETVHNYKKTFHPKYRAISQLRVRVERFLRHNDPETAWDVMQSETFEPRVTQHPEYQTLLGMVAAKQIPPNLQTVREAFEYSVNMGHEDIEAMRTWFYVERTSGIGLENAINVCDYVLNGKRYGAAAKAEFWGKKGFIYTTIARSEFFGDQDRSFDRYRKALTAYLTSYSIALEHPQLDLDKNQQWVTSCCEGFLSNSIKAERLSEIFDFLHTARNEMDGFFDPAARPIINFLPYLLRSPKQRVLDRHKGLCTRLVKQLRGSAGLRFHDSEVRGWLVNELDTTINRIEGSLKMLRAKSGGKLSNYRG